jgi:hypothetical protein
MQSNNLPVTVQRSLGQIQTLLGSGDKLEAKEIDRNDLSRILIKMPEKHKKEHITATISKLFEIASSKMKDEHDKSVLTGLR